jgi:hypothetical protein
MSFMSRTVALLFENNTHFLSILQSTSKVFQRGLASGSVRVEDVVASIDLDGLFGFVENDSAQIHYSRHNS